MIRIASANTIAEIGRLVGDAARANMLSALMDGRALTAGELAARAGISPQTASGHLAKLTEADLIRLERQGRHRYFRIASTEVAEAIGALMVVAATGPRRHHPIGPRDEALRLARTCWDHMAGRLAVALTERLCEAGHLATTDGAALVTDRGRRFFCDFGIDLDAPGGSRRPLCRTCLDWSERRHHVAGRLGAALLDRFIGLGWVARTSGSRALRLSGAGENGLATRFGLAADWRRSTDETADRSRSPFSADAGV